MKTWKLLLLAALILGFAASSMLFVACGGSDEEEDEDDDSGDEMCPEGYPDAPACDTVVSKNGQEWTACDNGDDISYYCAKAYAEHLDLDGSGWRLPTLSELHGLLDTNAEQNVECDNLTISLANEFTMTCTLAWSSEELDIQGEDGAYAYSFAGVGSDWPMPKSTTPNARVLAVRD